MSFKIVAESNGDDVAELAGYDKWPRDISLAFDRALGEVSVKYLKNRTNRTFTFAAVVADYRALEAEYIEHLRDNADNVLQVRRIITERLLMMAWGLDEPFETSLSLWQDLQQLGFHRIERKITETLMFARTCCDYGQVDLGLEVLDPVLAEVEQRRAKPNLTEWAMLFYDQEIAAIRKLRAELEAERAAANET